MPSPLARRVAVWVLAALLLQVIALTILNLPGVRPEGFSVLVDGWLQAGCFVTAALLAALRWWVPDRPGVAWAWIAAALGARAFAFVWFLAVVRWQDPIPYPSLSDLGWLLTVVLLMTGLVTLARAGSAHFSAGLVLDGVAAVLGAAALAVTLLYDVLVSRLDQPGAGAVVVTNLGYPVLDVMLAILMVGVLAGMAWRPPLSVWALAVGTLGFLVTDGIFLSQITDGTFRPGTWLTTFTVITNAVIAMAGWLPDGRASRPLEPLPSLATSTLVTLSCLFVLVYAAFARESALSVLLAAAGVVTGLLSAAVSFRTVRDLAARDPQRQPAELARAQSVDRLRRAIDDQEIVLHFQPVVSLPDERLVGVEALARWQRPGVGLVPPHQFLPLAESAGLMSELTPHVIDLALRQGVEWRTEGRPMTMAVNISATNLLDDRFADVLARLLEQTRFPAGSLQLELTEDVFLADPDSARRSAHRLLRTGVQLVLDDYGTGYSSLSYVRDLHQISGLKLDRSFVTHVAEDARSAAIVESTLALCASLELDAVAEGVETVQVREHLVGLGCRFAQGFLFARPAPAEELDLDQFTPAS